MHLQYALISSSQSVMFNFFGVLVSVSGESTLIMLECSRASAAAVLSSLLQPWLMSTYIWPHNNFHDQLLS